MTMDANKITQCLTALFRTEIVGTALDCSLFDGFGTEDWKNLYELAKSQDLTQLAADAIAKNAVPVDPEIKTKFDKKLRLAVYRYQITVYELERIKKILNEAEIPFIPLKGSVLRQSYPQPWMRTSSDIDILVHENDLSRAIEAMKAEGLQPCGQTSHDVTFKTDSLIHLELQFNLFEESQIGKSEQVLNSVWERSAPIDGTFEYRMSDEMFYYYHLAHMAKHLEFGGGCGIRPFLDLWVLNHSVPGDDQARFALLRMGGLEKFAEIANELVAYWMEEKEPSELALQLQHFIFTGGIYGTEENAAIMRQGKRKSRISYIFSRLWIPYEQLVAIYPGLKGKRILQPLYEIRRWFRLMKRDVFKRSRAELKNAGAVSDEEIVNASQMLSDLGLNK